MRKFIDERYIYPISEEELLKEYNVFKEEESRELTFPQYIDSCLSINNGTLTEIKESV